MLVCFFINEGNAQEFNIGYNNNGEFTLYNANTSNTPLKVFPNGEINIPNGIHTTNITPTVGGLLNVEKSGANVLIRTIADEPNIAGLDIGTPSDPDKHRIRSLADSDDLHIVVNNSERMRFRNNRVGINTAEPQQLLDVGGRGLFRSHLEVGLDTGGVGLTTNDGGGNASVTFNHTAQIPDQDGNVGRIRVNTDETTNALMEFQIGTNKTNGVSSPIPSRYVISANAHIWNKSEDNATEAMRLDSSGNLLVSTTDTSPATNNIAGVALRNEGHINVSRESGVVGYFNRITSDGEILNFRKNGLPVGSIGTISGDLEIHSNVSGHTGLRFANGYISPVDNSGVLTDGIADLGTSGYRFKDLYLSGGVITSSDYRLKKDIQPMQSYADTVKQMNLVNFAWKESGEREDGFIAHELQALVPNAVRGDKDAVDDEGTEQYQGVDPLKLIPVLTKALQEALERIETLENK